MFSKNWESRAFDSFQMQSLQAKMERMIHRFGQQVQIGEKADFQLPSMTVTLQRVPALNLTDHYTIGTMGTTVNFPPLNISHFDPSVIISVTIPYLRLIYNPYMRFSF